MECSPVAVVIGAGVIGLTCAVRLLETGWRVVVYTHDVYPNITSAAAGALWEYPPYMIRAAALPLAKKWSIRSMEALLAISHEYPTAGVGPVDLIAVHRTGDGTATGKRLDALAPAITTLGGASDDPHVILDGCDSALHASQSVGAIFAAGAVKSGAGMLRYRAVLVDPTRYMPWLMARVRALGGSIVVGPAVHDTVGVTKLASHHGARVVVNAAGIAAGDIVGDDNMYGSRGALVAVYAPHITESYVDPDYPGDGEAYVIPRGNGVVMVGGTSEKFDLVNSATTTGSIPPAAQSPAPSVRSLYNRCVPLPAARGDSAGTMAPALYRGWAAVDATHPKMRAVLARGTALCPGLTGAPVVGAWVGVRPLRKGGFRYDVQRLCSLTGARCGVSSPTPTPTVGDSQATAGGCGGGACLPATAGPTATVQQRCVARFDVPDAVRPRCACERGCCRGNNCSGCQPLPFIQAYGHGGAGFTLSWGCADLVAQQAALERSRAGGLRSRL